MTNPAAPAVAPAATDARRPALQCAQICLYVMAAAAVALAVIVLFVPTSTDDSSFHHIGDYFLTADGIPSLLPLVALLPALRTLQRGRDGRLARTGVVATAVGSLVLVGMFVYGLIAATGSSLGPTYVIASAVAILGVLLFAIGSWRSGLLPRWLLVAWPIAFAVGGTLPVLTWGPFLLAAVYLALAILLPRRLTRQQA